MPETIHQFLEVGRNGVGAVVPRRCGRQRMDEFTDDHQHRRSMVARLDRNGAGLRCIVDHGGKLEYGVERVVACHDAAVWVDSGRRPCAATVIRCCIIA